MATTATTTAVVLEPASQAFVEATASPPFLYELTPDEARKVLDDVQAAPIARGPRTGWPSEGPGSAATRDNPTSSPGRVTTHVPIRSGVVHVSIGAAARIGSPDAEGALMPPTIVLVHCAFAGPGTRDASSTHR